MYFACNKIFKTSHNRATPFPFSPVLLYQVRSSAISTYYSLLGQISDVKETLEIYGKSSPINGKRKCLLV